MAPELALGGVQRWLQSVIVHPGSVELALASREAAALVPTARLECVVRPSATLTASERVGIYHGMYRLRMAEALESDYPGLAHFLGRERFMALVGEYVLAHPSTSYTLNDLGRRLPEFLRRGGRVPSRAFCRHLARLEWAVCEAFDAAEEARLGAAAIEALAPEDWPDARLVASPALRLVPLGWNAADWLDTAKDEAHRHPRPRRRAQLVVVFRREYAVYRRAVDAAAFRLLSDLAAGRTVGQALSAALRRRDAPDTATVARWFRQWAADGLFVRVDTSRRPIGVGRRATRGDPSVRRTPAGRKRKRARRASTR
jgi:hypothetical protein